MRIHFPTGLALSVDLDRHKDSKKGTAMASIVSLLFVDFCIAYTMSANGLSTSTLQSYGGAEVRDFAAGIQPCSLSSLYIGLPVILSVCLLR